MAKQKMKVVHIINGLESGGAEGMLLKLLKVLHDESCTCTVISLRGRGVHGDAIEALGISLYTCHLSFKRLVPGLFHLWRAIKKEKPDIVQTWLYHGDLFGGLMAFVCGHRHIFWNIRRTALTKREGRSTSYFMMRICAKLSQWLPKKIVCNAQKGIDSHIAVGYHDRFVLIQNGFDLAVFKPGAASRKVLRQSLGLQPDTLLVGLVARFDVSKNHAGFFEMVKHVQQAVPQAHFILAGSGITKSNQGLVEMMRKQGLEDQVHFLGERDDIPTIMAALDVAVQTSSVEGFPNTVGEAMACAVPMVSTEAGDVSDIMGDARWLVPLGDMESMAEKVIDLLCATPEYRQSIGQSLRQRIKEHFSIEVIAQQYRTLYLSHLASKGKG